MTRNPGQHLTRLERPADNEPMSVEEALRVTDLWFVTKREGGSSQAERQKAVEVLAAAVRAALGPEVEPEPSPPLEVVTPSEAAHWWKSHARAPEQPTREARLMLAAVVDHAVRVPNAASVDRFAQLYAAKALRDLAAAHEPADDDDTAGMPASLREVYRAGMAAVVHDALERARAFDHGGGQE